mmetsp:Transcript_23221/g.26043  ORF Transcript_23221/g.26043 Transcript_23221/m.26043 type:complete len:87 (+) Transcript_23221:389-649(+)
MLTRMFLCCDQKNLSWTKVVHEVIYDNGKVLEFNFIDTDETRRDETSQDFFKKAFLEVHCTCCYPCEENKMTIILFKLLIHKIGEI